MRHTRPATLHEFEQRVQSLRVQPIGGLAHESYVSPKEKAATSIAPSMVFSSIAVASASFTGAMTPAIRAACSSEL